MYIYTCNIFSCLENNELCISKAVHCSWEFSPVYLCMCVFLHHVPSVCTCVYIALYIEISCSVVCIAMFVH